MYIAQITEIFKQHNRFVSKTLRFMIFDTFVIWLNHESGGLCCCLEKIEFDVWKFYRKFCIPNRNR